MTFGPPVTNTSSDLDLFNDPYPNSSKHANDEQELRSENNVSPLAIRRRRGKVPSSKFIESVEDGPSRYGSPTPTKKGAVDGLLNRPLPEIPARKNSRLRLSRTSSMKSQAPSLTPSLISCLDRELSSPEPEICTAKIAKVIDHISPPKVPSLQSDSDPMDSSDLVETPVKDGSHVETTISVESSLLPSIEEMSPMLPRHRSPSPTGFSPRSPMTAIKRKPTAHMDLPQEQYLDAPPHDDMLSSPNITVRKHRRSTFKKIPKSNTTANLPTQRDQQPPWFHPMRNSSVSESQWMSRRPRVPPSSSMRSGLGHESAWKAVSPTLPTSSSSQSGFESTHSNNSNNSGLKNVMNLVTTKGSIISDTLKRNSTTWYRKARSSANVRSSEDSIGSSQNSSIADNASETSSAKARSNWI